MLCDSQRQWRTPNTQSTIWQNSLTWLYHQQLRYSKYFKGHYDQQLQCMTKNTKTRYDILGTILISFSYFRQHESEIVFFTCPKNSEIVHFPKLSHIRCTPHLFRWVMKYETQQHHNYTVTQRTRMKNRKGYRSWSGWYEHNESLNNKGGEITIKWKG